MKNDKYVLEHILRAARTALAALKFKWPPFKLNAVLSGCSLGCVHDSFDLWLIIFRRLAHIAQHDKSTAATDFVTRVAGRDPNLKTIFASFSDQLGERTNREVQRIMRSDAYIKIFGRTRLDIPGWSTNTGGAMIATLGRRPAFRSGVELLEFLADFLRPPVPQAHRARHLIYVRLSPKISWEIEAMNRSSFAHEIAPTRVEMECVADTKSIVGESPLWSAAEQCVYFVDIPQRRLHRLNVGNMMLECFSTPDIVTAVALRRGGGLILTFERTLAFFDLATKSFDAVIDMTTEPTGNRFNDGKCDRQGRFWAGTMSKTQWDEPCG